MLLKDFADLLISARLAGSGETVVEGLATDSRKVRAGDLFVCIPGFKTDGHQYAEAAASNGASALVVERVLDVPLPQLVVKDSRHALAVLAAHFYRYPSREMRMIGVTGTNGKTTTTSLIERILHDAGKGAGLIGTIRIRYGDKTIPADGTTPDALELQRLLRAMADEGTEYCAMEVSSHALDQGRVKGCDFKIAVFTNLTQDHLDYHETMDRYKSAKGLLFARLGNEFFADPLQRKFAVLNADDPAADDFAALTAAETITYGIERFADIMASDIQVTPQGTRYRLTAFSESMEVETPLIGKFNVYNTLAAVAVGLIEGIPLSSVVRSLKSVTGVEGRLEPVIAGQDFSVVVDYAHTPDGLENVLRTLKEIARKRLICVFGCGGDRDRAKRPIMGRIAAEYADYIVLTSDNPRTEDPERILDEIEQGLQEAGVPSGRYERMADRKLAIQKAVEMASCDDVVLIAGKGHETYQIIGGQTYPFDDRLIALEAIRRKSRD
jgi:UDP-N-acetylmuramoyl-L-alanyl-D-glutamate--2,6-diaminopimelate ligase